ncbi:hypothetical protein WJX72_004468 [[Myrmecia] bisecta]|uniref:Rieske domain-containing protein n=1 Tax=[Myrmecia] bisecta TaxID=41462 RepID=A0AAW1QEY3_9CHLO
MTFHKVAPAGGVAEDGDRLHLQVEGRYVSLVRSKQTLHCIDSVCFHAGGPLTLGDIENLEGRSCLVCPWHYYKIAMDTGEKYYQGLEKDAEGKLVPGAWKSVGARQRVHRVEERTDGIYVALALEGQLASDAYAEKRDCGERVLKGHTALNATNSHHIPGYSMPADVLPGHPGRSGSLRSPHNRVYGHGEGEDIWPDDLNELGKGDALP